MFCFLSTQHTHCTIMSIPWAKNLYGREEGIFWSFDISLKNLPTLHKIGLISPIDVILQCFSCHAHAYAITANNACLDC